jgi:hypothetical protein
MLLLMYRKFTIGQPILSPDVGDDFVDVEDMCCRPPDIGVEVESRVPTDMFCRLSMLSPDVLVLM